MEESRGKHVPVAPVSLVERVEPPNIAAPGTFPRQAGRFGGVFGFRGYGDEGTLKLDSRLNENVEGALNNGIQVGVYFYSQAVTVYEAVEEASVAVNYSRKYNITLPIY